MNIKEASKEHIRRVEKLTIADILQLNNEGFIPTEMTDNLYYFLLDNISIKRKLKELD